MAEPSGSDEASRGPKVYRIEGREFAARPLAPGLHLVATPIGNLGDVTLRALETLAAADLIACEDTRVTARLLERYGIRTALTPYHDHNAAAARPKILARLHRRARPCAGDAGAVRDRAPHGRCIGGARRGSRGPVGHSVPRADQAARRDPPRHARRTGARLWVGRRDARRVRPGDRAAADARRHGRGDRRTAAAGTAHPEREGRGRRRGGRDRRAARPG